MPFLADKLRGRVYNQSIRFRKSKIHKNYFFAKLVVHIEKEMWDTLIQTHTHAHTHKISRLETNKYTNANTFKTKEGKSLQLL